MRRALAAAMLLLAFACAGAQAGEALDRVRRQHGLSCGAEPRPGVAEAAADGSIRGLAVDLCRAVAIAVLGPDGRVAFRLYRSSGDFDALRHGREELAFLSAAAIAAQRLTPRIAPGPAIFFDQAAVMVPRASPARHPRDLAGATVCFMIGSAAESALDDADTGLHLRISRLAFQEDGEMLDAYEVGRCSAMADEATRLAAMRHDGGINHLQSRILASPLALLPLAAATPAGDGAWSALAFAVLRALIRGDDAGKSEDGELGLRPGWRREVRAATGFYGAMLRRDLGAGSPLRLSVGPNAAWPKGLLLKPDAGGR